MKKHSVRALVVTVLAVGMMLGLSACGLKNCDICGELKECNTDRAFGVEMHICKDYHECGLCGVKRCGTEMSDVLKVYICPYCR